MTEKQRQKNLSVPRGKIDVVLDTDAYNEIDDQFAIAYLLKSKEKLRVKAISAAPFHNARSTDPGDGMRKSYDEVLKLLSLLGEDVPVFLGAEQYLADEHTPVLSPAAQTMVELSGHYSPENPLYIVAIGAITNVASALLLCPEMKENVVVVWLGGHAHHFTDTLEFNMKQDFAAARVVMQSGVPFVQLPCMGVVDQFRISGPELRHWFLGKNPLADYLVQNTVNEAEAYSQGKAWTRVIWDVTAVAWLLNDENRFLSYRTVPTVLPAYEGVYEAQAQPIPMTYVYHVWRDALLNDLILKITQPQERDAKGAER